MAVVSVKGLLRAFIGILKGCFAVVKVSLRVVVLILLTVLLAAGTAYFLVQKLVRPDDVSLLATNMMRELFRAQVTIETARVDPFRGITIEGLKVYGRDSAKMSEFLSVDNIIVNYELLPLLKRRLVVKEITINAPRVNFIRGEDGSWNVPEIAKSSATTAERSIAGFVVRLDVAKLQVSDASVSFKNLRERTALEIYNASFRVWNFNPYRPFPFRLAFSAKPAFNGKPLDIGFYSEGLAEFSGFHFSRARLSKVNVELSVAKKPIYASLELSDFNNPNLEMQLTVPLLEGTDLNNPNWYPHGLRVPNSTWEVKAAYSGEEKNISISSLKGALGPVLLSCNGWLRRRAEAPALEYKFNLEAQEFSLEEAVKWWPPAASYVQEGRASMKAELSATEGQPPVLSSLEVAFSGAKLRWRRFNGSLLAGVLSCRDNFSRLGLALKDGTVKFYNQEYSKLSGWLDYSGGRLEASPLHGQLNASSFRLRLDIQNLFSPQRKIEMHTYFARLKLMEFFDTVADTAAAIRDGKPPHPVNKHTGELAWLRNFRAAIPEFMPNFRGTLLADQFVTPVVSGRKLAILYDLKGLLPGMQRLNGTLKGQMQDGTIHQLDRMAQQEKALGVAYTPFVMLNKMEKGGAFKVGEVLKDVPYRKVLLSSSFSSGDMRGDNFVLDGSVLSAAVSGNINWVAESMNLDISTLFSVVSKHGGLSESMTDESGKPALAFALSGGMGKLQLVFNRPKKVAAFVQNAITRGAGADSEKLGKLAGGGMK